MAEFETSQKKATAALIRGIASKLRLERVLDGFQNVVTGAGTSRSKVAAGEYTADPILDCATLESLFESNDLAYVIVSKIVDDALRDGYTVEREGGSAEEDREFARKIYAKCEQLCVRDRVHRGAIWGRLFGDGGLIIGARTAPDEAAPAHPLLRHGALATPLKDEDVEGLEMLVEWDRQDLTPYTWYPDGETETYLWTPPPAPGPTSRTTTVIHESRLLRFSGAVTTSRGRARNQHWNHSVLQRVFNTLKSFDAMFSSTDAMFADASQAVFKLQGLIQSLAEADGSGNEDVQTRLQLMDLFRSSAKMIALDAGDETGAGAEDFSVVDRNFGSLDGIIDKYYVRLAAAARMPLTVLLGMSPAGMDATGEADMILYYNSVDIFRKQVLEPRIMRLVRMVARELGDNDPSEWRLVWPELARPKPLDVRTAEKMAVDGAVALIQGQVCAPEEVALSLQKIAREGISGLVLDVPSRQRALKAALEELEEMPHPGAKPEPAEGGPGTPGAPAAKSSERKTPSKTAKKQV